MATPFPHAQDEESQALLPDEHHEKHVPLQAGASPTGAPLTRARFGAAHLAGVFVLGLLTALGGQALLSTCTSSPSSPSALSGVPQRQWRPLAPPYAGSTVVQPYPPASPTNARPELFPTDIGFAGPTPTGAEPALVATAPALPLHSGAPHLVAPPIHAQLNGSTMKGAGDDGWDLFRKWGNLSPWYSVPRGTFGVDADAQAPAGCAVTGLHFLHRHGARYPTGWASYGGPANFSSRLNQAASKWTAKGELDFLNEWTYKLGEEILTPFGRQQLYDLGVSLRMKYGFLLNNFTASNTLPVFRTESQDRMLYSAQNFAAGFFGLPFAAQYQQLVTVEADGFNNTLAPYKTCPNAQDRSKGDRGSDYLARWADVYLHDAHKRIGTLLEGYDLRVEDVYAMQQTCAYESVALGFSRFCDLFTREEWEGFDYALDLYFWYGSAFGSPVARVQGVGYVQELVARLTHTPIATHNSSTNATLHADATFPLGHALYVDATHEVVVLNVLAALNLSSLAASGPLRVDKHVPAKKDRSFVVSELAPFATNVGFQLLSCANTDEPEQLRVIVNDGVVPLSNLPGCGDDKLGLCPLSAFVDAQKTMIRETDWEWGCYGDWTVPAGEKWETTDGYPPAKPEGWTRGAHA